MLPAPPVRLALPEPPRFKMLRASCRGMMHHARLDLPFANPDFELAVQQDIDRANAELTPVMVRVATNMARLGMLDRFKEIWQ
jgi:hypothetical protein